MNKPVRIFVMGALCAGALAAAAGECFALAQARTMGPFGRGVQPPARFVLIDRTLSTEAITLLRWDAGQVKNEIAYLDAAGVRVTRSLGEVIALAPAGWTAVGPASVAESAGGGAETGIDGTPVQWLELVDGQRLSGSFASSGEAAGGSRGEAPVLWRHPRFETVTLPIDAVARYVGEAMLVPIALRKPMSNVSDTVVLINGDRAEGFVERLGTEIEISPLGTGAKGSAADGTASKIDAGQVVLVNLANERKTMGGSAAWLADGSIIAVERASSESDKGKATITMRAPGKGSVARGDGRSGGGATASIELSDLRAIVPDATRLVPLSGLTIAAQRPSADRPWGESARVETDAERAAPLGAADVVLPGPMAAEWTLPAGASAISGAAVMDESCWAWGDCVVVFSIVGANAGEDGAGREIARARLKAGTPVLNVKADLGAAGAGDRLRVRVEAGMHGAIQDRVTLKRFIVATAKRGA